MTSIPSVGIIMDGNRRWAKARDFPPWEGHRAGLEPLKKINNDFFRLRETYGLEYVIVYAFSTENWGRDPAEVQYLMSLFAVGFQEIVKSVNAGADPARSVKIRMFGQRDRFSPEIQKTMHKSEEQTAKNTAGTMAFALSYGGRSEILEAAKALRTKEGEMSEEDFSKALWTGQEEIPDPDIIIRTGGEQRLSNFLPWQSIYSELFFTDTLWPDFSVSELEAVFKEFQGRSRRHGK